MFAERVGKEYGVDPKDILTKIADMGAVGGQEDWIIGVHRNWLRSRCHVWNQI